MTENPARFRRSQVGIVVLLALFCAGCGEGSSERETEIDGLVPGLTHSLSINGNKAADFFCREYCPSEESIMDFPFCLDK